MNGAEALVRSLLAAGVRQCFANPGTSEMHLVQALDAVPELAASLCLFEGVCTGAADGYGRISGMPAATLLHLGAGLGNGLANLHNARRASTPLINLVGDHALDHEPLDAPLTSDVVGVARPMSAWVRRSRSAAGLARDGADAVAAALTTRPGSAGQIATLVIPADCAWGDAAGPVLPTPVPARGRVPAAAVEAVARLGLAADTVLLLDGPALQGEGLVQAGRIAAATGCRLLSSTFPARVDIGVGRVSVARMPYFPEQVVDTLAGTRRLVLAGAERPVSFFAYRNLPGDLVPAGCEVVHLAQAHDDLVQALTDLADALEAPAVPAGVAEAAAPVLPEGKLNTRAVAQAVAALMPEGGITAVDSGGGGAAYAPLLRAPASTWLNLTGGSIGMGGPVATGAALASPSSRVFALLGDGGAMYTNQAFWTQAREGLDVTTVIFNNSAYNILDVEYRRIGVNQVGAKAASLFDIGNPEINWTMLAGSMGVPGLRVTSAEAFNDALARSIATPGPMLIEAMV